MFLTEGIQKFMGTVMNIDNQDLVNKMEGFTIQGVKGSLYTLQIVLLILAVYPGSVMNHQQCISQVRSEIQDCINQKLRKFTCQTNKFLLTECV